MESAVQFTGQRRGRQQARDLLVLVLSLHRFVTSRKAMNQMVWGSDPTLLSHLTSIGSDTESSFFSLLFLICEIGKLGEWFGRTLTCGDPR